MADSKVSALPAATTPLAGTELVYLVQSGNDVQATAEDVALLVDLSSKQDAFTLGTGLSFVGTVLTLSTNLQGWSGLATSAKQDTLTAGTGIDITGNVISATGGGGGLTSWTEAVNTAAPNATVPAVSFTATNAATNVDAVLAPKGTGAFLTSVPDNASSGGNKRGTNAVDLQRSRNNAIQVASGNSSVLLGGDRNRSSGVASFCGGGQDNIASATVSAVVGGSANNASASNSFIGGGESNVTSGGHAAVPGGQNNQATGNFSWVPGGRGGLTRGIIGVYAWSAATRSSIGDNQCIGYTAQRTTSDATPTLLTADRANPVAGNVFVLPNNSSWSGKVHITGRATSGDQYELYLHVVGARGANASTTVVKATNPDYTYTDTALVGVSAAVVANTTRGSLEVEVTGLAATTIDWFAHFDAGNQIAR